MTDANGSGEWTTLEGMAFARAKVRRVGEYAVEIASYQGGPIAVVDDQEIASLVAWLRREYPSAFVNEAAEAQVLADVRATLNTPQGANIVEHARQVVAASKPLVAESVDSPLVVRLRELREIAERGSDLNYAGSLFGIEPAYDALVAAGAPRGRVYAWPTRVPVADVLRVFDAAIATAGGVAAPNAQDALSLRVDALEARVAALETPKATERKGRGYDVAFPANGYRVERSTAGDSLFRVWCSWCKSWVLIGDVETHIAGYHGETWLAIVAAPDDGKPYPTGER